MTEATTEADAGQRAFDAIDGLGGPGAATRSMAKEALFGIGASGDPLTPDAIETALGGLRISPDDVETIIHAVFPELSEN